MPGMDGFELLREIRTLGLEAGGNVPVIAMSAFWGRLSSQYLNFPVFFRSALSQSPERSAGLLIDHKPKIRKLYCFSWTRCFNGSKKNKAWRSPNRSSWHPLSDEL